MSMLLKQNKISAFTLIELIIVMALTALTFFAGYIAFNSSNIRIKRFKQNASKTEEVTQLNFLIYKDFEESSAVTLTDSKRLSIFKSHNVNYFFKDDQTIRESNNRSDTFYVSVLQLKAEPVILNSPFIKRLDITLNADFNKQCLTFEKSYTAYFLITQDTI